MSPQEVIIVGAGIFGVSTALFMLERGGYDVTILDKSKVLPAPDAASTDLNKIVRNGDYADPHIARLNVDAVDEWRKPQWKGTYHQSGVIIVGDKGSANTSFVDSSYENCRTMGLPVRKTSDPAAIRAAFPAHLDDGRLARFDTQQGYLNPVSGWAEAGRAVEVGIERVKAMGGEVRAASEVVGLLEEDGQVRGVKLASGETLGASLVVVAAGAWTPSLFARADMGGLPSVVATGQSIAVMQLTPQEVREYADVPVIFDLSNGFYVFPPNPEGLMKVAIHGAGYLNPNVSSGVSEPRTKLTPGAEDGSIPKEMAHALRQGLSQVYPRLAREKDFVSTRLCWYADTADGDWLIDWHPRKRGLLLATAGCGHAFKFLPNIGREVLAKIEGTLDPALARKWAFEGRGSDRDAATDSDVRPGTERKVLRVEQLTQEGDLKAKGGRQAKL